MNDIIRKMSRAEEVAFECNDKKTENVFTDADIDDTWARLNRFSAYVRTAFPETESVGGIIDSPLLQINETKNILASKKNIKIDGKLYAKRDDCLAVCGSLKARGGIYTVFKHAEEIALNSGMLKLTDDYSILNNDKFRELFSKHKISVGSTGNLGMSIGLSGKKLGFETTVYMSEEAKMWKKEMLRDAGVNIVEFKGDYTSALELARAEAAKDDNNFFIDDEDSRDLFLGYSAVCRTFEKQVKDAGITVDEKHPLMVYLPCGVGGGPGGITFGLKSIFGESVHCYFGEPTQMPCMAYAFAKGNSDVSVYDIGLNGGTVADGLACSSPSALAYRAVKGLLDGCFTVDDEHSLEFMRLLYESTEIKAEPSSCVSLGGIGKFEVMYKENATHVIWLTGGSLVPDYEWNKLGINLQKN